MARDQKALEDDLSLPLDIETEQWTRLSGRILTLLSLAVVALVVVAAIAPVREVAIAKGELVTLRDPVLIEHLEGGVVQEVHAREGDLAEAGTPLITIAPGTTKTDLSRTRIRRAFLVSQRGRLAAHMRGVALNFDNLSADYSDLMRNEMVRFDAESAQMLAEENAVLAEIDALMVERDAAKREITSVQEQIRIDVERASIQTQLVSRGLATRTSELEASARAESVRADLAAAEKVHSSAVRAIADARYRLASLHGTRMQEWTVQDAELSAEIVELDAAVDDLRTRLADRIVTAPEGGIVHEFSINGIGEVLAPGDHIATIIPIGTPLIAEVKVLPADIGHIEVGLPAEVVVTTFDKEVYGSLNASVASISATTFSSPEEEPFYRVRLALEDASVQHGSNVGELLPGMVVQGEILTGERSLLEYMLKPLVRAFDRAFTER